jgi:propionyl-CoA synthetase
MSTRISSTTPPALLPHPHGQVLAEVVGRVRDEVGPIACYKHGAVVARLPKTRSGKVLRATMRLIADGKPHTTPATIDDPAVLGEVAAALAGIGFGRK